ncbi:hypothetical protein [Streptomyces sp. NPDC094468]|uniref:hypothetical protein n=1 Tax=Streptomyces sp. NPDC094468 TaxID=3366066 RepID=UPI003805430A
MPFAGGSGRGRTAGSAVHSPSGPAAARSGWPPQQSSPDPGQRPGADARPADRPQAPGSAQEPVAAPAVGTRLQETQGAER